MNSTNTIKKQVSHCTIAVSDWMAGGCDVNDIPRPQIAVLLAFQKEWLKDMEQPAQPQHVPISRTDRQIVDETEKLAVWLLSWFFNHQPKTETPMRESTHPFAERCLAAACHIQEMLTATDPENAVAELAESHEPAKRQYYYQVTGCTAEDWKSKDCICWHDEGTGPRANEPEFIRSWRTKP